MTGAIILAAIAATCVVFALGVYFGRNNHGYAEGRTDGYGRGYDQGRFDAHMDALYPDEERAAYEAAMDKEEPR
jgi:hypothetical protein